MKLSKRILDGNEGIPVAYILKLESNESFKGISRKFLLVDAYRNFDETPQIPLVDIMKDKRRGAISLYHQTDTAQEAVEYFTMQALYNNAESCLIALREEIRKVEYHNFSVNSLMSNLTTIADILGYYKNIKVEDVGKPSGLLGL